VARRTFGPAVLAPALVALLAGLVFVAGFAAPTFVTYATSRGTGFTLETSNVTSGTCNPWNLSPSALAMPVNNPDGAKLGDYVNASYQYRTVNYTAADHGDELFFPLATAVFPLANGSTLKVNIPAVDLFVQSGGWSSPAKTAGSIRTAFVPTFSRADAYLTTSKLAVMTSVGYGNLTIEVRWHWSVHHVASGVTKTGKWSVPTRSVNGAYLPSIFYPAPWVGIVATSGARVAPGSTYDIELNGSVTSTWFRLVLEYPNNGTNLHSIFENTTSAPTFNATVPMTYGNGTGVAAGPYLIHVHDHCEAILHILSVTAT
jgi:hypothetical protein